MNRQWAIVEAMGHRRYAGQVTLELGLVRVDIPDTEGPLYLGTGAIFAISPCTEAAARAAARGPYVDAAVPAWARVPEAPALPGPTEEAEEIPCCGDCLTPINPLNGCECGQHDGPHSYGAGYTGDDDYQATGPTEPSPDEIDVAVADLPAKHGPVPPARSEAWLAGEKCGFSRSGLRSDNPYAVGSGEHVDWDLGFTAGENDIPF